MGAKVDCVFGYGPKLQASVSVLTHVHTRVYVLQTHTIEVYYKHMYVYMYIYAVWSDRAAVGRRSVRYLYIYVETYGHTV